MAKPPAARVLDQRKVPYELFLFDGTIRDAVQVAGAIGHLPSDVYKTLVVEEEPPRGKCHLVMVRADHELDLKAFARAAGLKRARMASQRDAEHVTGLRVGGISALALIGRGFIAHIVTAASPEDSVVISAGQRGADVRLRLADLLAVCGADILAECSGPALDATNGRNA